METLTRSYLRTSGDKPLLTTSIPAHFQEIVNHYPDHEAVVAIPQQKRLSYEQLNLEIGRVARGLVGAGFGLGDRVGIWSTNNLEWILVQMGCARIGAVLVNINPSYRISELAYCLRCSLLQGLFFIPAFRKSDYAAMLTELLPEVKKCHYNELANPEFPYLRRLIYYDPSDPENCFAPQPGMLSWGDFLHQGDDVDSGRLDELGDNVQWYDPVNIQFTSGTTGHPKAVLLTHHNILNNAYFAARAMGFTERDRLCVPVPFYHCFGTVLATLLCFSCGACEVICCEHFDPQQVLTAIARERCTGIHGVPTMFIGLLDHPNFKMTDTSSLRTGIMAGAPCPESLMKRVISEMNCSEILIGYGQTEASPLTHLTERDGTFASRVTTVGRNLPHQEAKVVSTEDGTTLATGEVGEICFRGYHLMKGYYNNPAATAEAIDDEGWLHSGDLGTMDSKGYVAITGRLKDMIIRGGENIYPAEIEQVIFEHSEVAQVAVFGIPDDYWGEEIMAWIILHRTGRVTAEEIRDYCGERLAHFKVPVHVHFVSEFPLTVTGKQQKFRMRELAVEELAEGRQPESGP
ncbi:MAG: AMP-binding protein [Thermodesulfobacteriota bacterium]